jgi:phosphomannomutase
MVGVSGVRGEFGSVLTVEIAHQFGRAFAAMLGEGKSVCLGRDTRQSGQALRDAIAAGLTAGGIDVVDLGVVSTPGVALMIQRLGADGGIVITASHNPLPYNGIKFMTPEGLNLPADQAARLRAIWQEGKFTPATRRGRVTANAQTHDQHVQAVLATVDAGAIRAKCFRVAIDCINGAGCHAGPKLLEALGCQVSVLNGQPTGQFAHEPEPLAKNLTGLCEAVRRGGAQVGFAQDPDADRLAIVDENGRYIGEEYSQALAGRFVLRHTRGDIATNLSSSRIMDDVAAEAGVRLHRSAVGEANVVAMMKAKNCVFGGEGGGGVIDPRVVGVRNSLSGMALVLNYLAETDLPLSQLVSQIPSYAMLKDKFACPAEAVGPIVAAVKSHFAGRPEARACDIDGLRIDLPEGWVLIRASNTEPIMRTPAEAPGAADAQRLSDEVRQVVNQVLPT